METSDEESSIKPGSSLGSTNMTVGVTVLRRTLIYISFYLSVPFQFITLVYLHLEINHRADVQPRARVYPESFVMIYSLCFRIFHVV